MRGSTLAWCNKHGVSDTSAVLDISVALPGYGHLPPFNVRGYFAAVSAGLDDIDMRWSRTTAFISEWRQYWKPSDSDVEATTQSYLRQEAEAVSLRAKLHVAKCLSSIGVQAINLQHDGLVVRCGRSNAETLRRFFAAKSSQALRYPQPVEVKPMEAHIPTTPSPRGSPMPHHEALKCPLFFDPSGPPAPSNYNARLALEKKALCFARAGFSRLEHLTNDQRSLLSEQAFLASAPAGSALVGYAGIVDRIPLAAIEGLQKGPDPQQLSWVALPPPEDQVVAKVLGPAGPDHLNCIPHSVCARSGTLESRKSLRRVRAADITPCRVQPAVPGPKLGECGPPAKPAKLLARDISIANLPAATVGTKWPVTFERRPPTPLSLLSVSMARRIYNAKLWTCPRTFAEGADGFLLSQSGIYCHALALSYKDAYRRREIRDIFRDSRHPLLPERLAELAYRVLVSGFWLGSNKIVRRRGDTDICSHCGLFETTEHVFCTCDKAQRVWEHLLKWWYRRTSEHVAPSVRALLLGLRYHPDDDQDTLRFEELALPFLFLRTHTYDVLKKERVKVHKGGIPSSPMDLSSQVLRDLQHSTRALYKAACLWDRWHPPNGESIHFRSVAAFVSTWIKSGLALFTKSHIYPVLLRISRQ